MLGRCKAKCSNASEIALWRLCRSLSGNLKAKMHKDKKTRLEGGFFYTDK